MRVVRMCVLLGLLIGGCGSSSDDDDDGSSGGVVWKDAQGRVVPGVVDGRSGALFFADARGFVWKLETETAEVDVAESVASRIGHTDAQCGAGAFLRGFSAEPDTGGLNPPPPRYTFTIAGDDEIRARGDASRFERPMLCSESDRGACTAISPCVSEEALPVPTSIDPPLTAPQLGLTPPFHPEVQE